MVFESWKSHNFWKWRFNKIENYIPEIIWPHCAILLPNICHIYLTLSYTRYLHLDTVFTYIPCTYIFAFDLLHLPLFFLTQKILSKSAYLLIGQPFFCSYFWMTHFFMVLQSQGGPSNFRWISEEGVLVLYDDSAVWIRRFVQKFYLNPS